MAGLILIAGPSGVCIILLIAASALSLSIRSLISRFYFRVSPRLRLLSSGCPLGMGLKALILNTLFCGGRLLLSVKVLDIEGSAPSL